MTPTEKPALPPETLLLQLVMGKHVSMALSLAARLRIADRIDGPTPIGALAAATHTNADSLYRMMRALAAFGVFAEGADKTFALTPVSERLRSDHPRSMRAMCQMHGDPWAWATWGALDHAVRTGEPAFDHVHGMPIFEYFAKHPDESKAFGESMTSLTSSIAVAVATAYDFSGVRHLVDVGGSHGILAGAVVDRFPGVHVTVLDLAHVVDEARARLASHPHKDRITAVSGSFFEPLPRADAYVMKSILHDWDDASCVRILSQCRAAMESGGRVLVVEGIVTNAPESTFVKLLDLQMLVATSGGRERTETEYAALLQAAGLKASRVVRTPSPFVVLEAHAA